MPNAALASASFTNLSRPSGAHSVSISSVFGLQDRPDQVCALLQRLAAALPQLLPGTVPTVTVDGPKTFKTSVKVASPAVAGAVTAMLQRWAWYAARREGLHLDEATDDFADPTSPPPRYGPSRRPCTWVAADIDDLVRDARLERYGAGETVQLTGSVPDSMRLILTGRAHLTVAAGRRWAAHGRHALGPVTISGRPR